MGLTFSAASVVVQAGQHSLLQYALHRVTGVEDDDKLEKHIM